MNVLRGFLSPQNFRKGWRSYSLRSLRKLCGEKFSPGRRVKILACSLAASLCLLLLVSTGRSHEPITTSVTFNKEIIRIFQRSCFGCHDSRSLVGIPLTTYEEARPWAKAIKEEVLEKRMPPFQALKGYGSFRNGYLLPQRDLELIVSWVEGGAPRGDAKDLPRELNKENWPLGEPDLVLQPASETSIAAGEGAETRCFVPPTYLQTARWLSAVDFQPGNRAAVESAEFLIARAGADPCNSRPGEKLGEWVPGQTPGKLPEGAGRLLPAHAKIVLRIRYRKSGEAVTDRSRLGLYFTRSEAVSPVSQLRLAPPALVIPPGAGRQRVKASYLVREKTEAVAVRPLMFPLGRSVEVTAFRPDGTTEVLIVAQNYRYAWQPVYYFSSPVALPAGTLIEAVAYLDNSDDNPNLADAAKSRKFAEPLCEILLARSSRNQMADAKSPAVSSSAAHKH
jgi:hypothetical protein